MKINSLQGELTGFSANKNYCSAQNVLSSDYNMQPDYTMYRRTSSY